jgi:hypothetical protein
MVVGRYDSSNILIVIIVFGYCYIDFIEGECELFHLSIMIIHIIDNAMERRGRYGTYFVIPCCGNAFNGGPGNCSMVGEGNRGWKLDVHSGEINVYVMFL